MDGNMKEKKTEQIKRKEWRVMRCRFICNLYTEINSVWRFIVLHSGIISILVYLSSSSHASFAHPLCLCVVRLVVLPWVWIQVNAEQHNSNVCWWLMGDNNWLENILKPKDEAAILWWICSSTVSRNIKCKHHNISLPSGQTVADTS